MDILHGKWILTSVIPVFMFVFLVTVNHRHRDCSVSYNWSPKVCRETIQESSWDYSEYGSCLNHINVDLCSDFKTFYGCTYIYTYIYIYEIVNYLRFLKMVSSTQFHCFALLHELIVCLLLLLIHIVLVLLDSFVDLLLWRFYFPMFTKPVHCGTFKLHLNYSYLFEQIF